MDDSLLEQKDSDALAAELAELRAEVTRLQAKVDQLDQLAHQDVLIGLPNRRGSRFLETPVCRGIHPVVAQRRWRRRFLAGYGPCARRRFV